MTIRPFRTAVLCLLIVETGNAEIIDGNQGEILFTEIKTAPDAIWSSSFRLTKDGLSGPQPRPKTSYEVWLQSGKFPAGLAWRPPRSANVNVQVFGRASIADFPLEGYVRYGCDGAHWSTWYHMKPAEKRPPDAIHSYTAHIWLPSVAGEEYEMLMRQWQKTDPDWPSDEDALCRWILKRKPDFFRDHVPFIGYIEIRLEDNGLRDAISITRISVATSWGVGGLHVSPKEGTKADYDKDWCLELDPSKAQHRQNDRASN